MRLRYRLMLVLVVGLAFLAASNTPPADPRNIAPRADYAQVAAQLQETITREMQDKDLPAFSIALVDEQTIVWAQGFGYQDPDQKKPATAHTIYRVGSVSKLFTDIGIMQLVEGGKIDLDAPVSQYVPDFHPHNPFGKPITLRELTSHRSGLLREPPVGNYFDPTEPSLQSTVESLNSTALVYAPGTHIKYSNAGIAVVGYALQQLEHQPFAAYLKGAVLDAIGMKESAFQPEPALMGNLAKAYMWSYDGLRFEAPKFQLGLAPAGCMYSTVTDLGQFLAVLFARGRGPQRAVIRPETLEQMWTPQFAQPGQKTGFGIGFHLSELDGHRVVGHGGAIYGFATELMALPDQKLGVAAVTTMDAANSVVSAVAERALRLMLANRAGKALEPKPTSTPVSRELARTLAGRYANGNAAIDLLDQANDLFLLPASGGFQLRLRSLGDALVPDGRIDENLEDKIQANPEELRLHDKVLKRVQVPVPTSPSSDLQGLIGEYGWDHDILYVLEKDGKLNVLIEWFEYDPLQQVTDNIFKFPDHGLYDGETATFTRDASGRATQVAIGAVIFKRRPQAKEQGGIFQITPPRPVAEMRREALAAQPPRETGSFRAPDLVDVTALDPAIHLDIRYATNRNFLGTPVYSQAKAFLQRPAAEALARASRTLHRSGYGLLIHDAYRPWYVTKIFWDATPADKKIFVADPKEGSRHNRGCAVDLTVYNLRTGQEVPMTGGYDEMSERSYAFYPGGTSLQRWDRALLRDAMEKEGFRVYDYEWWHFDYQDWRQYPILNVTFEQLAAKHASESSRVPPDSAKR